MGVVTYASPLWTWRQTDLVTVLPRPSTTHLPYEVATTFHALLTSYFFSYKYKLENRNRCLNCELAPSEKNIYLLDRWIFVLEKPDKVVNELGMLTFIRNKNKAFTHSVSSPGIASEQCGLACP